MEEKKPNELNIETLDQVAGGGGFSGRYGRAIILGNNLITSERDLHNFVYKVLAKLDRDEIISLLSTCTEYDLVSPYKIGGLSSLLEYLDKRLSACGNFF